MYLAETAKIDYEKVELLKKMNATYPQCTMDYDTNFLMHLLNALFPKSLLNSVIKNSSLRVFPKPKLALVKSNLFQHKLNDNKMLICSVIFRNIFRTSVWWRHPPKNIPRCSFRGVHKPCLGQQIVVCYLFLKKTTKEDIQLLSTTFQFFWKHNVKLHTE